MNRLDCREALEVASDVRGGLVAILLEVANASEELVFFTSALGIIPTAALMGRATEELARDRGPESAA